jgi:hypothetical protein
MVSITLVSAYVFSCIREAGLNKIVSFNKDPASLFKEQWVVFDPHPFSRFWNADQTAR